MSDRRPSGFKLAVDAFKRDLLQTELTRRHGNRTATARALGITRSYVLKLIRWYALDVAPPRPSAEALEPARVELARLRRLRRETCRP